MDVQLVVLLGAPTSGKSTIGRLLAERFRWRWCEWEVDLLHDWGDRANLIANKSVALEQLHARVRTMASEAGPPVVYETTGLSDCEYLDRHSRDLRCITVRLDVGEREMLTRLRARVPGEHLTDSEAATSRIWSEFTSSVVPTRTVDLVIDTEVAEPARACALIFSTVEAARLS